MLNGNLCVAVKNDTLIVRLGEDQAPEALLEAHAKPFRVGTRTMKGWIVVSSQGIEDEDQLKTWVQKAIKFVSTLPAN